MRTSSTDSRVKITFLHSLTNKFIPQESTAQYSFHLNGHALGFHQGSLICAFLFQVQPKHVKEAFRLLNKSIIRVETPDVQFDDDEEEQQEGKNYEWCNQSL